LEDGFEIQEDIDISASIDISDIKECRISNIC
jgi:hypothetical protein